MKRKKTLESDAISHSYKLRHPAHDGEQQQHCSCSNSRIATHRAVAAEMYDGYIQTHTRVIRRTAAYSIVIILSGPGTLLWNHTRCLTKRNEGKTAHPKKRKNSGNWTYDLILSRSASYLLTTRCLTWLHLIIIGIYKYEETIWYFDHKNEKSTPRRETTRARLRPTPAESG